MATSAARTGAHGREKIFCALGRTHLPQSLVVIAGLLASLSVLAASRVLIRTSKPTTPFSEEDELTLRALYTSTVRRIRSAILRLDATNRLSSLRTASRGYQSCGRHRFTGLR